MTSQHDHCVGRSDLVNAKTPDQLLPLDGRWAELWIPAPPPSPGGLVPVVVVETPGPAMQQHDGGPLAHRRAVGHERGAVDVKPKGVSRSLVSMATSCISRARRSAHEAAAEPVRLD